MILSLQLVSDHHIDRPQSPGLWICRNLEPVSITLLRMLAAGFGQLCEVNEDIGTAIVAGDKAKAPVIVPMGKNPCQGIRYVIFR